MEKVLFSSNSDDWSTPLIIYESFIKNNYFDPCPLNSKFDGLLIDWKDKNFVNPPYSKIKEFVNKSIEQHELGRKVVLLIPARTDTKYFRKLVDHGCIIYFVTGRLHFNDSNCAPFPSCLVILKFGNTYCKWIDRDKVDKLATL